MFLWHRLQKESKPILIYGMGNGAEKILAIANEYNVTISGIFVSNDHARQIEFCGYRLMSFDEAMEKYPDATILIGFGVYQEDVLHRIEALSEVHPVFVPDVPLMGGNIITPDDLNPDVDSARALLADEKSRMVFDAMLEAKITGELLPHFREDTLREADMNLLSLSKQEHYLDLGAYNGDTIAEFLSQTHGKYTSIDAFEPDAHNYKKLAAYAAKLDGITLHPYASWNENTTLTFSGKGGRNSAMKPELPGQYKHIHSVEAISVDSLNKDFTFVKMDVEGAEAETLLGMRKLLSRCHPKLLISAYHKPDDFITLPLLLNQLCPGYQIYMRRNRCLPAWEIQLYCVY